MITIPLLAPDQSNRNLLTPDGAATGFLFPPNAIEMQTMGRFATWELSVRGPVNPTGAWALTGRFLKVVEHTFGPQYANPATSPFTTLETQTYVRERGAWGRRDATSLDPNAGNAQIIADNTVDVPSSSNVHVITRTVENWMIRHALDLRATGALTGVKANLAIHFHN